jgi:hypothetical protein
MVVGAYTSPKLYDECRALRKEHDAAAARIARVAGPKQDPVFGSDGPLVRAWDAIQCIANDRRGIIRKDTSAGYGGLIAVGACYHR